MKGTAAHRRSLQFKGNAGERYCCSRAWIGKGPKTYANLIKCETCNITLLTSHSRSRYTVQDDMMEDNLLTRTEINKGQTDQPFHPHCKLSHVKQTRRKSKALEGHLPRRSMRSWILRRSFVGPKEGQETRNWGRHRIPKKTKGGG